MELDAAGRDRARHEGHRRVIEWRSPAREPAGACPGAEQAQIPADGYVTRRPSDTTLSPHGLCRGGLVVWSGRAPVATRSRVLVGSRRSTEVVEGPQHREPGGAQGVDQ